MVNKKYIQSEILWLLISLTVCIFGCGSSLPSEPDSDESASLSLRMSLPGTGGASSIGRATIIIKGEDFIIGPLPLTVTNNIVAGTIQVPPGVNREITLLIFDNENFPIFLGKKILTIVPGYPIQVTISLVPLRLSLMMSPASGDLNVGETFAIEPTLYNVIDLASVIMSISYDSTRLKLVEEVTQGAFPGDESIILIVREPGRISFGTTRVFPGGGVSGSGSLVRMVFEAVGTGTAHIQFGTEALALLNDEGAPVDNFQRLVTVNSVLQISP